MIYISQTSVAFKVLEWIKKGSLMKDRMKQKLENTIQAYQRQSQAKSIIIP